MTQTLTRRQMMKTGATAVAGLAAVVHTSGAPSQASFQGKIPLLHITDLYHPPQDPDDLLDLLTIAALDEFDLLGVILDVTEKFLEGAPGGSDIPRDPGFVPVAQLSYLVGRPIPVGVGPVHSLSTPDDTARDAPFRGQAGVRMLLDILHKSHLPVFISVVGSARMLTAAYNREPDIVRAKTHAVLLNAGSTDPSRREWNVDLDPAAYVGLWKSGLAIRWYPCATERGAFDQDHERGTYWKAQHAVLFRDLPMPLRGWISHCFTGNGRGDIIRALGEGGQGATWENLLGGYRNMWSTASLIMAAGRVLARTHAGWRFLHSSQAAGQEVWPWRLDPVEASVDDLGNVVWKSVQREGRTQMFARRAGSAYGAAMAEALNALFVSIKT